MKFYTQYDRPEKVLEAGGGEVLVDRAGYVSVNSRINEIISAGFRLKLARAEDFDFPEGSEIDETFEDPTRHPEFDRADASQTLLAVNRRIQEARTRAAKETPKRGQEIVASIADNKVENTNNSSSKDGSQSAQGQGCAGSGPVS